MVSRDWGGYRSLLEQAIEEHQEDLFSPPEACPFDGSPLEENSAGNLNCPMGDYRWCGGLNE